VSRFLVEEIIFLLKWQGPAVEPILRSVDCLPAALARDWVNRVVKLTTYLYLMQRLSMSGAINPLP